MLKFIYDENVEIGQDMEFIEQLLIASAKYGVNKLKVSKISDKRTKILTF
jgi:hypothetical protein